jgi:DNA-binding NtrC family response regulator
MRPKTSLMTEGDYRWQLARPNRTVAPGVDAVRHPRPARRARVLVADDEPRIRLALRACLESAGYEVDEAADGLEALEVILRRAPDVMVLDLAMPNLDGMRALQELEPVHGLFKPRVIVLTAWGSMPAALRAIGLGASEFLEKPLVPDALVGAVERVLAEEAGECDSEQEGVPVDWDEPLRQ